MDLKLIPILSENEQFLDHIPVINTITSYSEFFNTYLIKNQPCIIKGLCQNWIASEKWIVNNKINFQYLLEKYKGFDVPVYNCKSKCYNPENSAIWKFDGYLSYWQEFIKSNHSDNLPLNYLIDWHLQKENADKFYDVPIFFQSDWLNEFLLDRGENDYRFVYMGPKRSWTPFHADVFHSYSWSANIIGKKRWILFPPGEEAKLRDNFGNLPFDIDPLKSNATYFEIIQETGDAVFVPSGWHHQVFNLADTISINHNWINGCNLMILWNTMESQLNAVKKEIADCKDADDFLDQCQTLLAATFRMDLMRLYDILNHIAQKRLKELDKTHSLFDLNCIRDVLELFVNCEDVQLLERFKGLSFTPNDLLSCIKSHIAI